MREFRRCKKCLMPITREGLKLNEDGVCYPCINFEERKKIDWDKRYQELIDLCLNYIIPKKDYNCLITVSGGKDSMRQVGLMKEELGMNPLCLMIDNFSWTDIGRDNYYNLSERFGVNLLCYTPNRKLMKDRILEDFVRYLHPAKFWDEILYWMPHRFAANFDIKLVVWGENPNLEKGGSNLDDPSNALKQTIEHEAFKDIKSIFLDYYIPWSRYENVGYAIVNGMKTLDNLWERDELPHFPFEQVDTIGYLVNEYAKFIKFGFGGMTELCSDAIRHKVMTREEGLKRVREFDWKIDPLMLDDFCEGLGINENFFWDIIDKHANKDLLYKDTKDGLWKLKEVFLK